MPQTLSDVMTPDPVAMPQETSLDTAAQAMRDHNIGDVVVTQPDGSLCGIVTDRDIVVRGIAGGLDPATSTLGDVCTHQLTTTSPGDSVSDAIRVMKDSAIRRLPVVEDGKLVGIVSLGDLAELRDPDSVLGEISSAPPNN